MNLEKLKNETLTKLKTCKREQEAGQVVREAEKKMADEDVLEEKRSSFWKDIHEKLGERDFSLLETQAKSSVDRVIKVTRERISKLINH